MNMPEGAKVVGDVAAGSVIAASWMDYLQGALEITGLVLAVAYGIARLYDTKMYRDIVAWLRREQKP